MRMPPPDWGRFQVHSRAQDNQGASHTKLGDPTRWGARNVLNSPPGTNLQSAELIRVQAQDNYSRCWALIGNVTVPQGMWLAPSGPVPASWNHWLLVSQGVGQATVIQRFDLRLLTTIGLNVYAPIVFNGAGGLFETRSFAIIGGLIGQAIAAVQVSVNLTVTNFDVDTSAIISPFAAGTGL